MADGIYSRSTATPDPFMLLLLPLQQRQHRTHQNDCSILPVVDSTGNGMRISCVPCTRNPLVESSAAYIQILFRNVGVYDKSMSLPHTRHTGCKELHTCALGCKKKNNPSTKDEYKCSVYGKHLLRAADNISKRMKCWIMLFKSYGLGQDMTILYSLSYMFAMLQSLYCCNYDRWASGEVRPSERVESEDSNPTPRAPLTSLPPSIPAPVPLRRPFPCWSSAYTYTHYHMGEHLRALIRTTPIYVCTGYGLIGVRMRMVYNACIYNATYTRPMDMNKTYISEHVSIPQWSSLTTRYASISLAVEKVIQIRRL